MVENVHFVGLKVRMAPVGLQMYANDFLSAAKIVPQPNGPFAPARIYLVCHALELGLKAFLSLRCYSLDKLADNRKFSHNLEGLLTEAERANLDALVLLDDRQKAEIRRASKYYSAKVFEYPAIREAACGYPELPEINVLIKTAESIVTALKELCLNAN